MRTLRVSLVAGVLAIAGALAAVSSSLAASAPTATSSAATNVGSTTATLNGSVNPNSTATEYAFQYGTTAQYGEETQPAGAGSGSSAVNESATPTDLAPGTTYHYRIIAISSAGTAVGSDETLTTTGTKPGGTAPTATTAAATGISATAATLNGSVNPNGTATSYHFEYGTTPDLGAVTADKTAGSGSTAADVSAIVDNLPANTKVYYRVDAVSPAGVTPGTTSSFTTSPAPATTTTTTTTTATNSTVAVGGQMGFVSPGSPIVGVWVSCLNGTTTCAGTLSLTHNGTIASRHFTLKPGAAGFVHLTLTAHGLHLLHQWQALHKLMPTAAKISGTSISHALNLAEWTHNGSK